MSVENRRQPMSDRREDRIDECGYKGPGRDLTGRDQLLSNVLLNWGAYSVFLLAGFIMPRMIDRRLGQESLGVWDFSWSLVHYFELVRGAIGSSVNRYVSKYRACGDISSMNSVVSSAVCILVLGGLLVIGLTVAVSWLLPQWFGDRLGNDIREAQWVVFFLGISLGVQIAFSAFNGVLTGCHRWGLHNINTSGWYALAVAGMIVALLLGGRLWTLAAITLAGEILACIRRLILAYRVCGGLRVRVSLVRWAVVSKLFVFGGKTLIPSVSNLLLNQTTSVLIIAYLGPAALALYTRPRSLILHVQNLVNKMAMTLTPTISSLQSRDKSVVIKDLVIKSTQYALYIVLPIVLTLCLFGGPIMQLWMGRGYANGVVPAILAIGHLPVLVQLPALCILAGLNAHGRAGVARLIASLCSVGLTVIVLKYSTWELAGTAIAVVLPLAIVNMVDIPLLMCRRVGLRAGQYYVSGVIGPVLYTIPFAICLAVARLAFHAMPLMGLAVGGVVGGAILAVIYWRSVLPDRVKAWVLQRWAGSKARTEYTWSASNSEDSL